MDVVDLTDNTRDGVASLARSTDAVQSSSSHGHAMERFQPKLGPQAAAALQAGTKRKLPDTFQKRPAISKHGKYQASADRDPARPAPPPAVRQPAVRITADLTQADVPTAGSVQASDSPRSEIGVTPSRGSIVQLLQNSKQPDYDTQPHQIPSAQRRMPESLAEVVNGSVASGHSKGTAVHNAPATASSKVGPSEHDTKVPSAFAKEPWLTWQKNLDLQHLR